MRRLVAAFGLLAALTLAALVYGPMAWDAWRFAEDIRERQLETSTPEARGAAIAVTCNQCHGENGNSRSDFYPALAGLPADYLLRQLADFASGRRDSPHMRPLALYLPRADQEVISAYYAKQGVHLPEQDVPAVPFAQGAQDAQDAQDAQAAAAARLQPCAACHGQALRGGAKAPRLAGQGALYLRRQLEAFRSGARQDATGEMASMARSLLPAEIEGLAKAASALRPAPP